MALDKELMNFLLTASRTSLKQAFLNSLGEAKNRREEIADLLDVLVEENAKLIAIEWFTVHGEELAAKLNGEASPSPSLPPAQPFALPRAFKGENKARAWRKLPR